MSIILAKQHTLPKPDRYGNYWLGLDHKNGPAIFPHKKMVSDDTRRRAVRTGTFTLLLGGDGGFAVEDGRRMHFDSAEAALEELNHRMLLMKEI